MEKNGEQNLIDSLYSETIELYKKRKGFAFFITLFLKIYKKKDLSNQLLKIFREINENPNENEKNMDRKPFLKDYTSKFEAIDSEADELVKDLGSIEFYGVILSYLNYYDYEKFTSTVNKLFENKPEDLYEILLIYKDNFIYPIKQDLEFFKKFISYVIEKKEEKKDEIKNEKKVVEAQDKQMIEDVRKWGKNYFGTNKSLIYPMQINLDSRINNGNDNDLLVHVVKKVELDDQIVFFIQDSTDGCELHTYKYYDFIEENDVVRIRSYKMFDEKNLILNENGNILVVPHFSSCYKGLINELSKKFKQIKV